VIKFNKKVQHLIDACGANVLSLKQYEEKGFHPNSWEISSAGWFSISNNHIVINGNGKLPGISDLVVLHELTHWTGTESRLSRACIVQMEQVVKTGDSYFMPNKTSRQIEEIVAMWGMYYLAVALCLNEMQARNECDTYISKHMGLLNVDQCEIDGKRAAEWLLKFVELKIAA
jgi:hypothetical protein